MNVQRKMTSWAFDWISEGEPYMNEWVNECIYVCKTWMGECTQKHEHLIDWVYEWISKGVNI